MAKGLVAAVELSALLVAIVLMAEPGRAAVDCNKARVELAPCVPYLTGTLADPPTACCNGVQYIKDNAVTKADKQSACQCIKDTAAHLENLKDSAAQQLASKCKIAIDVPISKTVDCSSI